MADPGQGVREMARVTRPGGTVAACMWDIAAGGMTMLRIFWTAVHERRPERRRRAADARDGRGRHRRALRPRRARGRRRRGDHRSADYAGFDDFWEPFTFAVGPAGSYLASLGDEQRERVREACRAALPEGAFSLDARAWYARGTVPG